MARPRLAHPSVGTGSVLADRYRVAYPLGSGGEGDVFAGTDLRLGRSVALKIVRPATTACDRQRGSEEAVLLRRLKHPGLIAIYDSGWHDTLQFLVLRLVMGSTLRERIAVQPMPLDAVVRLGIALTDALAHVHAAGVVHRDIKPSNILIDAEGNPCLADFGNSHLTDPRGKTTSDAWLGTPAYLSPEQVRGSRVGPAADVYALGLVLLECLKGRPEYCGPPLQAAIARVQRYPSVPTDAPEPLAAVLRAMTTWDELCRPSAHECAALLSDCRSNVNAGPDALALAS